MIDNYIRNSYNSALKSITILLKLPGIVNGHIFSPSNELNYTTRNILRGSSLQNYNQIQILVYFSKDMLK